jgi:hypothetical protein
LIVNRQMQELMQPIFHLRTRPLIAARIGDLFRPPTKPMETGEQYTPGNTYGKSTGDFDPMPPSDIVKPSAPRIPSMEAMSGYPGEPPPAYDEVAGLAKKTNFLWRPAGISKKAWFAMIAGLLGLVFVAVKALFGWMASLETGSTPGSMFKPRGGAIWGPVSRADQKCIARKAKFGEEAPPLIGTGPRPFGTRTVIVKPDYPYRIPPVGPIFYHDTPPGWSPYTGGIRGVKLTSWEEWP